MANKKISELEDLQEVTSDDLAVVVDISTLTTRRATMANLRSFFQGTVPKPKTEVIVITNNHLTNKSFNLTSPPVSGYNVTIFPYGGCAQFLNEDFIVTGSSISWDGYSLGGLLEAGDILQITYFY